VLRPLPGRARGAARATPAACWSERLRPPWQAGAVLAGGASGAAAWLICARLAAAREARPGRGGARLVLQARPTDAQPQQAGQAVRLLQLAVHLLRGRGAGAHHAAAAVAAGGSAAGPCQRLRVCFAGARMAATGSLGTYAGMQAVTVGRGGWSCRAAVPPLPHCEPVWCGLGYPSLTYPMPARLQEADVGIVVHGAPQRGRVEPAAGLVARVRLEASQRARVRARAERRARQQLRRQRGQQRGGARGRRRQVRRRRRLAAGAPAARPGACTCGPPRLRPVKAVPQPCCLACSVGWDPRSRRQPLRLSTTPTLLQGTGLAPILFTNIRSAPCHPGRAAAEPAHASQGRSCLKRSQAGGPSGGPRAAGGRSGRVPRA